MLWIYSSIYPFWACVKSFSLISWNIYIIYTLYAYSDSYMSNEELRNYAIFKILSVPLYSRLPVISGPYLDLLQRFSKFRQFLQNFHRHCFIAQVRQNYAQSQNVFKYLRESHSFLIYFLNFSISPFKMLHTFFGMYLYKILNWFI